MAKEEFQSQHTKRSQWEWAVIDPSDPMEYEYTFKASLMCSGCEEVVCCVGRGGLEPVSVPDEDGHMETVYRDLFIPLYFFPSLNIFEKPSSLPAAVNERLTDSFALFFCNKSAALNCTRQCVEEILNDKGVDRVDKRGIFLTLKARIDLYEASAPDEAENVSRAHALRWIGNVGSHPGKVSVEDVFDAYNILEVLLEDLYGGHRRSVQAIVNAVNSKKGSRHS